MSKECCGTCKYNQYDPVTHQWICTCDDSEYHKEWTDYGLICEEWKGK